MLCVIIDSNPQSPASIPHAIVLQERSHTYIREVWMKWKKSENILKFKHTTQHKQAKKNTNPICDPIVGASGCTITRFDICRSISSARPKTKKKKIYFFLKKDILLSETQINLTKKSLSYLCSRLRPNHKPSYCRACHNIHL